MEWLPLITRMMLKDFNPILKPKDTVRYVNTVFPELA